MATAPLLQGTVIDAIDRHAPAHVVLDAAGMHFLDAAGVTALITIYRHAAAQDAAVRLINVRPLVGTVLHLVDLADFLRAEPRAAGAIPEPGHH